MRKPIIAGNWKMNKTPEEAAQLVRDLIPLVKDAKCDVVVCTPAVNFAAVKPVIEGTNIKLGAQNVHFKASGAFTGELPTRTATRRLSSPSMPPRARCPRMPP